MASAMPCEPEKKESPGATLLEHHKEYRQRLKPRSNVELNGTAGRPCPFKISIPARLRTLFLQLPIKPEHFATHLTARINPCPSLNQIEFFLNPSKSCP